MSLSDDDDLEGIPDELRAKTLEVKASLVGEERDLDLEVSKARYERDRRHRHRKREAWEQPRPRSDGSPRRSSDPSGLGAPRLPRDDGR